ncbi:heme-binding protein 2 [Patella vulgata]|uniref:heme-binding protein 2 n=1 Tax=Patella vulgata TaxID=6465 RepID=UPI0024A83E9E|nr:heme-binding protein 2 [Patella vulgata]
MSTVPNTNSNENAVEKVLDMPKYSVVEKNEMFEERHYPVSKWASCKIMGIVLKDALMTGFSKLFEYIEGQNQPGQKVEMTAPVATKIVPGAGPNCKSTFTVSFFIPPENADNPPKPTDPDVFIETWPAQTIYAKRFDGFSNDEEWVSKGEELAQQLGNKPLNRTFWFTAAYDGPYKTFDRRNEVWYLKEDK